MSTSPTTSSSAPALEYVYGAAASWTNIDGIIENEFHDPTKSEGDNRRYWLNQPAKRADRLFDPLQHRALERLGTAPSRWNRASSWASTARRTATRRRSSGGRWPTSPTGSPSACGSAPKASVTRTGTFPAARSTPPSTGRSVTSRSQLHGRATRPTGRANSTGWDREFGEDVVVKTNTRDTRIMVEAVQRYTVALAEGRFTHDGDPDVQRHIDNMAPRDTRAGIVPIKATRNERIDAGHGDPAGILGARSGAAAQAAPADHQPRRHCRRNGQRGLSDAVLRPAGSSSRTARVGALATRAPQISGFRSTARPATRRSTSAVDVRRTGGDAARPPPTGKPTQTKRFPKGPT